MHVCHMHVSHFHVSHFHVCHFHVCQLHVEKAFIILQHLFIFSTLLMNRRDVLKFLIFFRAHFQSRKIELHGELRIWSSSLFFTIRNNSFGPHFGIILNPIVSWLISILSALATQPKQITLPKSKCVHRNTFPADFLIFLLSCYVHILFQDSKILRLIKEENKSPTDQPLHYFSLTPHFGGEFIDFPNLQYYRMYSSDYGQLQFNNNPHALFQSSSQNSQFARLFEFYVCSLGDQQAQLRLPALILLIDLRQGAAFQHFQFLNSCLDISLIQ